MRQFAICAIMLIVTSGLDAQFQEVPISISGLDNRSIICKVMTMKQIEFSYQYKFWHQHVKQFSSFLMNGL